MCIGTGHARLVVAGMLVCAVGLRQDDMPGANGCCASWSGLAMGRLG